MAEFTMLCGLSGAGKSTYAEKLCKETGAVHLASDKVRDALYGSRKYQDNPELIFDVCHKAVMENLKRGRSVVLDATNLKSRNRMQITKQIRRDLPETVCKIHVLVREFDDCVKQNVCREFAIPRTALEKQFATFQIPFMEEGWDAIILVPPEGYCFSPNPLWTWSMQELARQGENFDQHTPYHDFTLTQHCESVNEYIYKHFGLDEEDFDMTEEENYLLSAAFLHDYGKLFGHTEDEDGVWHYYGHAERGAYQLLCDCLKKEVPSIGFVHNALYENPYSGYDDTISFIMGNAFYVNYHMLPFNWTNDKELKRAKKWFGEEKFNNLMLLHEADIQGKNIPMIGGE